MELMVYLNLELYQMDVKTTPLDGDINETIYIVQVEYFVPRDQKNMVYKFKKFIYGLK